MRKRTLHFLAAGFLTIAGIWLGREALAHRALVAVLANPAPTADAMERFVGTARDKAQAVVRLWNSRRLQQRLFVIGYLRKNGVNDKSLWEAGRPLMLEAVRFADTQMQEDAAQMLGDHQDGEYLRVVKSFVGSADPEVRLAGLKRLSLQKDRQFAGIFAKCLDDPDGQVRTIAAAGLRNLTGLDFGTGLSVKAEANAAGIAQWKAWWGKNRGDFPEVAKEELKEVAPGEVYAFELPEMNGKRVRLSDYKGKVVLLNFWATWCPSCLAELSMLAELQKAHAGELVVLGINVDGVTDGDDHDPEPTEADVARTRGQIRELLGDAMVTYQTLLDPSGSVLGPYAAGNLPTNVVIGADGTIRRRMLGIRSREGWEEIIAAAKR